MTWLFAAYHVVGLTVIVVAAIRMHNRMYGDDQK